MLLAPALFIGHGSPMNALASNAYTRDLRAYAAMLPVPAAILVISAHWETSGTRVTAGTAPRQIYDFYGFPPELYAVRYAPQGNAALAEEIAALIPGALADAERGIDHAGWAVAMHLYPDANVPLLQMSLDTELTYEECVATGKRLAVLREQGVLIIGSGNLVHNLRLISWEDEPYAEWALTADAWLRDAINARSIDALTSFREQMPEHTRAVPTDEHYRPLLYVLGAMREYDAVRFIHASIQNGSISMRSVAFG